MTRHALVVWLVVAAGCVSRTGAVPKPFPRPHRTPDPVALVSPLAAPPATLAATALEYRGVPFVDGGTSPSGFDCSGFTYFVFQQHGIDIPRVAADQYRAGRPIKATAIQPGDLLFFQTVAPGASHVALALGGNAFVHAPSARGRVRVERLSSSYWSRRFLGARRFLDVTN